MYSITVLFQNSGVNLKLYINIYYLYSYSQSIEISFGHWRCNTVDIITNKLIFKIIFINQQLQWTIRYQYAIANNKMNM